MHSYALRPFLSKNMWNFQTSKPNVDQTHDFLDLDKINRMDLSRLLKFRLVNQHKTMNSCLNGKYI